MVPIPVRVPIPLVCRRLRIPISIPMISAVIRASIGMIVMMFVLFFTSKHTK